MKNLSTGFIAGFIATLMLSAFMLTKSSMELMTQINIIGMLTNMAHRALHLSLPLRQCNHIALAVFVKT